MKCDTQLNGIQHNALSKTMICHYAEWNYAEKRIHRLLIGTACLPCFG
jgi:hypothetical protein